MIGFSSLNFSILYFWQIKTFMETTSQKRKEIKAYSYEGNSFLTLPKNRFKVLQLK